MSKNVDLIGRNLYDLDTYSTAEIGLFLKLRR